MPPPHQTDAHVVSPKLLRDWPPPTSDSGEAPRARVLVVGGAAQTPGAAMLAAEAVLRAGAGKLQIATAASLGAHVAVALPEALVRGLPEQEEGYVAADAADSIIDLAEEADVVLLGPGLMGQDDSLALTKRILTTVECTVVLDALALTAVTADHGCLRHLGGRAVLTQPA